MHLVGFIIRVYHDARSPERQIHIESYSLLFCSEMMWFKPGIVVSQGKVHCVYSMSCCVTTVARWIGCVLLVTCCALFHVLTSCTNSLNILECLFLEIHFHKKNPSIGSRIVPCGRTERQADGQTVR